MPEPFSLLENDLGSLPQEPGVYLFRDREGRVLYVGKARNLRQRVRSYFQNSGETRVMIPQLLRKVSRIETIVAPDEYEAILLEETLIKEHRPRYNVRLRDDKSFLFLRMRTDDPFPYLEIIRRPRETQFPTFGPFASAWAARQMVKVLREFFPLRTCSNHKFAHRSRPCLDHSLGMCPAPCVGMITPAAYQVLVQSALDFLRGDREGILKRLRQEMEQASEELRFEDAALLRDRIRALEGSGEAKTVVRFGRDSSDIWGVVEEEDRFAAVVLKVVDGKVVEMDPFPGLRKIETEVPLHQLLLQYYRHQQTLPGTLCLSPRFRQVPELPYIERHLSDRRGKRVEIRFPERGGERDLLDMAERNAKELLRNSFTEGEAQEELARILRLPRIPEVIECYDVSHLQRTRPVGVQITFVRGLEDLSRRRYYKLKELPPGEKDGLGDPQWIGEMLKRRLKRGIAEGDLPDLILLDGGKPQLGMAMRIYKELEMEWSRVPVVALAKARNPEEDAPPHPFREEERIYLPGRKNPVILKRGSPSYRLFVRLRDTTHRAVLGFHRRSLRSSILLGLEGIPGMGPRRRQRLHEVYPNLLTILTLPSTTVAKATGIPIRIVEEIKRWMGKVVTKGEEPLSSQRGEALQETRNLADLDPQGLPIPSLDASPSL